MSIQDAIMMFRNLNKPKYKAKSRTFTLPSLSLLKDYVSEAEGLKEDVLTIETRLSEVGIEACVSEIKKGPVITRYEMKLARGVRLSKVKSLIDDVAMAFMTKYVRIQAPIPGTNLVGIDLPNDNPATIGLKAILPHVGNEILPIAVGVDTTGVPKIVDLAKMPHLLIAGHTGSGKSVCLNGIILSLLYTQTPDKVKLVLVDPKRVEMASYRGIPHLWRPIINDPEEATEVFGLLISEMEERYEKLAKACVRNIESYNATAEERMPYIVAVVDEMADLMMTSGKELEKMIVRLAQLARAVGIHLVLATQKPIVKVITGLIKSNMPSRIAFQVSSKTDSRVILDCNGAEALIGRGDMLMTYPGSSEPERFHGAWVSDDEIKAVTDHVRG